ncbi:MAG TPA: HIT family protein [Patescibacteria group bacterium]|nr:HIT family protein [Patescibacteria group bacterium]
MTPQEQKKQELYRDARFTGQYDSIWQSVGKCVFCDLRDKYVFYEDNGIVLTVAVFAYTDGHFMIIPRRHVRSIKELTPDEWETIRKCMYMAKKLIRKVHGIKGMQIVQKDGAEAQSTVEHLHFHCIPFDSPDLCTWNYEKLKNTPVENAELYKKQVKTMAKLEAKFKEKYQQSSIEDKK